MSWKDCLVRWIEMKKKKVKIEEISEEEYRTLYNSLEERAKKLVEEANDMLICTDMFFSSNYQTCAYQNQIPKTFRSRKKNNSTYIKHFLDTPCNKVKLSCKKDTVCICEDRREKNARYFKTVHKVGNCPWKKRQGEE
jgi:hypothetical protein